MVYLENVAIKTKSGRKPKQLVKSKQDESSYVSKISLLKHSTCMDTLPLTKCAELCHGN